MCRVTRVAWLAVLGLSMVPAVARFIKIGAQFDF